MKYIIKKLFTLIMKMCIRDSGYATQMCILDRETGKIEKMVAAHDVGKAVNPLSCDCLLYTSFRSLRKMQRRIREIVEKY